MADDEVPPQEAKAEAIQQRAEAQARWRVITPLVASLRRIREENHIAARLQRALRET